MPIRMCHLLACPPKPSCHSQNKTHVLTVTCGAQDQGFATFAVHVSHLEAQEAGPGAALLTPPAVIRCSQARAMGDLMRYPLPVPCPALTHCTPDSTLLPTPPSTTQAQTFAPACPLSPDVLRARALKEASMPPTMKELPAPEPLPWTLPMGPAALTPDCGNRNVYPHWTLSSMLAGCHHWSPVQGPAEHGLLTYLVNE